MSEVYRQQTDLATPKVCCWQIDLRTSKIDDKPMKSRRVLPGMHPLDRSKRARRRQRAAGDHAPIGESKRELKLHVAAWLRRLELKAADVAREARIGKSYLSQIGSDKKSGVSAAIVFAIADAMKIPVDALRHRPPDQHSVDAATKALGRPPESLEIVALSRLLSEIGARARQ